MSTRDRGDPRVPWARYQEPHHQEIEACLLVFTVVCVIATLGLLAYDVLVLGDAWRGDR